MHVSEQSVITRHKSSFALNVLDYAYTTFFFCLIGTMAQMLILQKILLTRIGIKTSSWLLLHLFLLFRDTVDFLLGIITLLLHDLLRRLSLQNQSFLGTHFKIKSYLNKTIWKVLPTHQQCTDAIENYSTVFSTNGAFKVLS